MFHLMGQIFCGLVIGTFAKLIMPNPDPAGVMLTALFGLLGSGAGTIVGHLFFGPRNNSGGWIVSIIGAVIVLVIYRFVKLTRKQQQSIFN